jgi:uncharacterized protein
MLKWLYVLWMLSAASVAVAAEDLEFIAPASAEGAVTQAAMRSLAVRALPVYQFPDRAQFLTNLSALQMVAGEYVAANATRQSLEEVRAGGKSPPRIDMALLYDMYARARAAASKSHRPFDQAFARVFRETVTPLSDRDAYTLAEWLTTPLSVFRENLQGALDRLRSRNRISLAQAVDLSWTYVSFEAFQSFAPLVGPLIAEDDARRYVIDAGVWVSTPDHASISVLMVRPRGRSVRLPALLELTTSEGPRNEAKESAAHGYAGLVAFARGTGKSTVKSSGKSFDASTAYEHDGDDARAVIDWITRQPWSDGRVGMFGTGYSAFAAWSAAKRAPAALQALAVASVALPGLDDVRTEPAGGNAAASRHLPRHPSIDRSLQQLVPYRKEFAHFDVPVLTVTGYYDEREPASLYYFTEHYRYDTQANHTLLIGPYDRQAMRRGPLPVLEGYAIDTAALIDLHDLRYRWFDHVLKGGPTPELLSGRVNFEVMGANEWRHVDSLRAMANRAARLYLDTKRIDGEYRLSGHEPPKKRFVEQKIPLTAPANTATPPAIVSPALAPSEAVAFYSGPLHRPLQLSGLVSGQLALRASRSDLDISVAFYELLPSGDFFQLFAPPYGLCARGLREQNHRAVPLRIDRLTSVELKTGSRLVVVVDADPSSPEHSASCIAPSAARPLGAHPAAAFDVRWYAGSFIEIPVSR